MPSSMAALAASQPPATAEGRRDREPRPWRAVDHHEILPDNHVRIEADASELEPVDRPELVRATVRPVAADVWLRATALKRFRHLSNVAPSQRCTSTPSRRGAA